jgi:RimJ/RimL family protein N-acetyltransferase/dTDP-4-dehydrorhamnose 3,5-epimerase-like enzyme
MLEWMHDATVVKNLNSNFLNKNLADCIDFINQSNLNKDDVHFAISNDDDEYMGTVSLKHINLNSAEFAIVVRKKSMGLGYSWYGMYKILKLAFNELGLNHVYWCVSLDNLQAIKFYEKHKFKRLNEIPPDAKKYYKNNDNLIWFISNKNDDILHKDLIMNCKITKLNTFQSHEKGSLSFFESLKDITFDIKRIYYIYNVSETLIRGFHAHKRLKQLIFCPFGEIELILDDGYKRESIILDDPTYGVQIETPMWREIRWLQSKSVVFVAASDYFNENDYIREYDKFIEYITKES